MLPISYLSGILSQSGTSFSPTTATLSGSTSAIATISQTYTVTLNAQADQTYTISWSTDGTPSTSSTTITSGNTTSSITIIWSSATTGTVDFTISPSLTRVGNPKSVTVSATSPEAPTTGFTTVKLRGGVAGFSPFAFGHAFKQGHLPSGSSLLNLQTTVFTTWPDGSAKTAVVAGYATITNGVDRSVGMALGSAAPGSNVTVSDLSGTVAIFDCGSFGSVTFSSSDFATPFLTVATGPVMSSWVFRKQVGSDAHLVAWCEVRKFGSGQMMVLPWIENGYFRVAGPSNRSATYTFTLNGVTKFSGAIDLKHHQRTPLISGTNLWFWDGVDPAWVPIHDALYLQSTELVPSYSATMSAGAGRITLQPTSFTPLQQGSFVYSSDNMAAPGYQEPIGLLPEHEVFHLVANDTDKVTTFKSIIWNGYGAGRYGIHYRDETTNRPPKFSSYTTLVFADGNGFKDTGASTTSTYTPVATGGNPPTWDTAHSPSIGYMAHLLTGFYYFIEEVQFAAISNHFNVTDWVRGGGYDGTYTPLPTYTGASGLCVTLLQTRAGAWWYRTLVQALAVTPNSGDILKTEFTTVVEENARYYSQIYVENVNQNPYGIVNSPEVYSSGGIPMWQQDFFTAVFGYSLCLGLPLSTTANTKLTNFFAWKAKSVIGRLDTSSNFWYINAVPYDLFKVSVSSTPDYLGGTGPWLSSWAAVYAATYATPPSSGYSTTEGVLGLNVPGDPVNEVRSMWGNIHPAISYAVRHGVSGASAAWSRLTSASNYVSAVGNGFNSSPVWGVKPLLDPVSTPLWMQSAGLFKWSQIANTSITSVSIPMNAWGSFIVTPELDVLAGPAGGHSDSYDNRVVRISLAADTPTGWTVAVTTSLNVPPPYVVSDGTTDRGYYYDDAGESVNPKPGARHLYDRHFYDATTRRMYLIGDYGTYPHGSSKNTIDGLNIDSNQWELPGTFPLAGNATTLTSSSGIVAGSFCYDPVARKAFWGSDGTYWYWTPGAATKSAHPSQSAMTYLRRFPNRWDPLRNAFFGIEWGDSQGASSGVTASQIINPSSATPTARSITFNASAAYTQFQNDEPAYPGMDYDVLRDRFVFFAAGTYSNGGIATFDPFRLYEITPNSSSVWDMSTVTINSGGVTPVDTPSSGSGVNGRFRYVSRGGVGGFLYLPNQSSSLYFFRTS